MNLVYRPSSSCRVSCERESTAVFRQVDDELSHAVNGTGRDHVFRFMQPELRSLFA